MRNTYQDIITKIDEIKHNKTISFEEKDIQISMLIQDIESPIREWLTIISSFNQYYSVPKNKREYISSKNRNIKLFT